MIKKTSVYICQQCSFQSTKWFGKCPDCGSWNSSVETAVMERKGTKNKKGELAPKSTKTTRLSSVSSKKTKRISTKITELDRVLGGGLVGGQVVLIAGDPGIGKSTLLLQVSDQLIDRRKNEVILYASGEESVNQIKTRADRLNIKNDKVYLAESADVDEIIDHCLQMKVLPKALIVDSIQTVVTNDLSGMAGSVGQVRECAYRLVRFAKENQITIFIVGHVTKQGSVAGPSVLMHIVDTVLWFEGDKLLNLRILRAVKNRFGPTDEVGIFSMGDKGLISMDSPEKIFLSDSREEVPGCVVASVIEGTRPILVEIQSLLVPNKSGFAKRVAQGVDPKKIELLIAVLQRRCGLSLYDWDCFVNVAGGISLRGDPSIDLAICLSIASSYFDRPISSGSVAIGEVGLLGDIRKVRFQEKREKEAKRLGYKNVITSGSGVNLRKIINKILKGK